MLPTPQGFAVTRTPVVLLYNLDVKVTEVQSKLEMHASNGVYSGTFQNNVILNSDLSLFIPRSIPITLLYILLQDLHSAFVEKVSTGELKQKCVTFWSDLMFA